MKSFIKHTIYSLSALIMTLFIFTACEPDEEGFQEATYPDNPWVFKDGFSGGLEYAAFGGSDIFAFEVVSDVVYEGTEGMRFSVPDEGSPDGAYAGGVFFDGTGRDLTAYNVLTFYMKASKSASIDVMGFGNDLGENTYEVSIGNVSVNTNWKKYYIPIPDASKLSAEKGMLFYSEGAENGEGYTFYIDEVRFENLGTLSNWRGSIFGGEDVVGESFVGADPINIESTNCIVNLPNGTDITLDAAKSYFNFFSSNEAVATVDADGNINPVSAGVTEITATLNGQLVEGSLTLNVGEAFLFAPTPTHDPNDVISIFSDAYTNVPVDFYNGYWEPWQTTTSADFAVNGDNILAYNNFNFVGNSFSNPTVDATNENFMHLDMFIPNPIDPNTTFTIVLRDLGPDGVDGGGDDTNLSVSYDASDFSEGDWSSFDIPLNMTSKNALGLIIYEGTNLSSFYLDNIYFY